MISTRRHKAGRFALGTLTAALLIGCGGGGGDDPTDPGQQNDQASQSIGPTGGTVVTPSGAAGVQIPAGTFSQPVTVTVARIEVTTAPGSGPLPTTLKQYGPFYELTTQPAVLQFADSARVGVCQVTDPSNPYFPPEPHASLRLAHRVGSDVEVLERVDVNDFLRCTNVTGSNKPSGNSFLARAIRKFFRPSTLYAAHGGLGGKVKSFSPFGAVQLSETSGLRFSSVSAGDGSTCGLSTIGRAYCWGRGIGNSSVTTTTPVAVGTQVYTEITASRDHVCAIASVNLLFCWGQNNFGQVGDGTTNPAPNPVSVFAARGSAKGHSADHTCALDVQLRAFCWGRNNVGQLGIGSVDGNAHTSPEPVVIANGSPTSWTNLSVGPNHTCGASGTFVFCWGANSDGKLGDGTAIDRSVPTKVQTNVDFSMVSVGDLFSCALTPAGQAYCWGQNTRGELGTGGTVQTQFTPVPVAGGLTFRTISAGRGHACGITPANKAYCWGTNSFGELGDLTSIDRPVPTAVAGNLLFESISVGGTHTCARDTSIGGIIYCWGNNSEGEVGDGTTLNHNIPIRIIGQP